MNSIKPKSSNKIVGIVLIAAAIFGWYWGETNNTKKQDSLRSSAEKVVSISSESVEVDNEGKLVHLSGKMLTEDLLKDPLFGISANAIKLSRKIEMYQWIEEEEAGSTQEDIRYDYNKSWSSTLIKSEDFKDKWFHENPSSIPFESEDTIAQNVSLGKYQISSDFLYQISAVEELMIPHEVSSDIRETLGWNYKFTLIDNKIFIGNDPTTPNIGDLKISFYVSNESEYSLVGQQVGEGIRRYQEDGDSVALLSKGNVSANGMFEAQAKKTAQTLWIVRIIAGIAGLFGFAIITSKRGVSTPTPPKA